MIELPESIVLAKQLNEAVRNKVIKKVTANQNPHKFAWFNGAPEDYDKNLCGKRIGDTDAFGGKVQIEAQDMRIGFSEGIKLRYLEKSEDIPKKHQLLIEFKDGTYLAASVQMYGGLWAFEEGTFDNEYYLMALAAISPLSDDFNMNYFTQLMAKDGMGKLSAKAFLATEQRIPGLGNGVLQDILYNAKIHPKRKIGSLSDEEKLNLFNSLKNTLREMTDRGGRDTERDLYGNEGGYKTKMSKNTVGTACPNCGGTIVKAAYMGGSVYYCEGCQRV
jgi:formamidopyrimidine-DNA glycosylase